MNSKSTIFVISLLALGIGICLLAPEAMAVKEDTMKATTEYLEKLVRGNFARIVVVCGVLWGVVHGLVQTKPIIVGSSVATGIGYGAANYWIDSAFTLLI